MSIRWRTPIDDPPSELESYMTVKKWLEDQEKKIKDEITRKAMEKKPFFGFSTREVFWYMLFLSPIIGIPVGLGYLRLIRYATTVLGLPN